MAKLESYFIQNNGQVVYPIIKASQVYIPDQNITLEEKYGSNKLNFKELLNILLPVGYIFKTTVEIDLTNFQFENEIIDWEWIQLEPGRVCIGAGEYTDINNETINFELENADTEDILIGEFFHRLTVDELPAHTHGLPVATASSGSKTNDIGRSANNDSGHGVGYAGGNTPHNNIQPSKVVYMYQRVR